MITKVSFRSFYEYVASLSRLYGDRPAMTVQSGNGWRTLTYLDIFDRSIRLARFLKLKNVQPGERVIILSEPRIEYPEMLLGIMMSGAVVVPMDAKLSPYEIRNIIDHAEPKTVFVSDSLWETFLKAQGYSESTYSCFRIDGGEEGRGLNKIEAPKTIEITPIDPNILSMIIYTSGTSGKPKGVMTRGSALLFEYEQIKNVAYSPRLERALSILPMNHLFEMTAGLFGNLTFGCEVTVARSLEKEHLMYCLNSKKITHICAVPLFLKSIKDGIENKVGNSSKIERFLFSLLKILSRMIPLNSIRRRIFSQVHKGMGGHLFRFIVGGAPLNKETAEFYSQLGMDVLEGYGLSETGPIISTNREQACVFGSAGQKIDGIQVRIDSEHLSEDGEILTSGPHVMMGYYKNDELTNQVLDKDGWFHTGDVGYVDKEGFLYITGRIKKMIVLEGGKKVMAEEVEEVLANCSEISEVCVLGSQKIYGNIGGNEEVIAVVVPSESVKESLIHEVDIEKHVIDSVKKAATVLTNFKQPTQIVVIPTELPKTTTMKVKINETAELVKSRIQQR